MAVSPRFHLNEIHGAKVTCTETCTECLPIAFDLYLICDQMIAMINYTQFFVIHNKNNNNYQTSNIFVINFNFIIF